MQGLFGKNSVKISFDILITSLKFIFRKIRAWINRMDRPIKYEVVFGVYAYLNEPLVRSQISGKQAQ